MVLGSLRKLADVARGNVQESFQPGFLRPIDVERIAREMKLEAVAAERGKANLPEPGSDIPDGVEQSITQRTEAEWVWQGEELTRQLRAYAARLVQYSIKAEFERLQLKGNDALARLRNANVQAPSELGPLRERYLGFRDELARFRARHRLERPARQPARRWTTFGLMFVLVAFESVLNGVFFAKGSEFGLLGGIGTAIGISIVNVVFSFLLGLFPARWIRHRNWLAKFVGLVLTAAGLAGIILVQAFAAHFREAMARVGEEGAFRAALDSLQRAPLEIADINSFYLFGLGVVCSLLAFWKGTTFDDPYPGYGAAHRRADAARQAYSDEHADLFDELEAIKTDTVAAIDDGIVRIPLFPQHAATIRAQRSALIQTFRGYETTVESAANQMLATYRDANRRHRSTSVPARFGRPWQLRHSFLDNAEVRTLLADVPESHLDVDGPLAELRTLSTEVLTEYQTLLVHYPHPTDMP